MSGSFDLNFYFYLFKFKFEFFIFIFTFTFTFTFIFIFSDACRLSRLQESLREKKENVTDNNSNNFRYLGVKIEKEVEIGGREGGSSYMERMKGKETDKEKEKEKSRERRKDREREREKERERNEDERKVSNNRLSTVFSQMLPQRPYRPSPVITEGLRNSPLAATLVRSISVLTLSINFFFSYFY